MPVFGNSTNLRARAQMGAQVRAEQPWRRLPLLNGHAQRRTNELGRQVRRHCPANNFARQQIQYGDEIKPVGAGPDVGDQMGNFPPIEVSA